MLDGVLYQVGISPSAAKVFITPYLCAATVRVVIFSAEATSFMEAPFRQIVE